MSRVPVDLIGGFYTDDSLAWSCQDAVNYLPVRSESQGTRTQTRLVDAPGLRPWVWIGHTSSGTASAPIRGLHDVEGKLFAVCGQQLYQISGAGVAVPRGTIPGVGRVSMAHNQITNGNQLLIVNGSSGYVWNTVTETLTKITDDGYPGAFLSDFIDGYLVQVEPFGRFLFHSDLNDALDYNTLDRFEAETAPDRIASMLVDHLEVWAFGERTIDIFENTGRTTGTFQNKRISIQIGCIGKFTPARIDNSVMWVGDDRVIYRAEGYQPVRVSTRAIEVALSGYPLADLREAFSFVWSDRGHKCYLLTIPGGQTWCYDVASQAWSRRATYHPSTDISGRWRLNSLAYHNGRWIGGDYQTGKLYVLDWEYMLDGCDPLIRERVSPVSHNNGSRFTVDSVELFFDTGSAETECAPFPEQPAGPQIEGDAPDGDVDEPYSYTYTTTAGDSPIVRTIIVSGQLLPGLSWNPSTATISGTPTESGPVNLVLRTIDANGLPAELSDSFEIYQTLIACSAESQYAGGQDFPTVVNVTLGTALGWVELEFATGGIPDKFEVWLGGVKRIDTGYVGDTSNQSALDSELASRDLPPETITQRTGTGLLAADWANPATRDRASFYKGVSDSVATVRVYGPMEDTGWIFALNCPDDAEPPP